MNTDDRDQPWLIDLATQQRGRVEADDGTRYDDDRQIRLLDGEIAVENSRGLATKKADIEVGEDQKK